MTISQFFVLKGIVKKTNYFNFCVKRIKNGIYIKTERIILHQRFKLFRIILLHQEFHNKITVLNLLIKFIK